MDREPPVEKKPAKGIIVLIAILLAGIAGFVVSIELTQIHYFTHADPTYHSVCAINETVNCETVAQSPYSVFMGLPISVWGLLAYTLIAVLAAWSLLKIRLHDLWARGVLFLLFTAAFVASALLAYLSFFRIDSMCLFCMSLYGINTLLFILGIVLTVRSRANPLRMLLLDVKALFRRPVLLVVCFALAGGVLTAGQLLVPKYWIHVLLDDLPDLPHGEDENGAHWIGAEDPIVTVTEFSDYECPFCRKAYRNARSWCADYPDEVRFIHRQLPLDRSCNKTMKRGLHKRACEFAKAAQCAAEQDMFWQMSDTLFAVQDTVRAPNVDLEILAVQIGLDRSQFLDCMRTDHAMEQIEKDMAAARKRKITGTPTYYINSQRYVGGFSSNVLKNTVEAARKRRGAAAASPPSKKDPN